MRVIVRTSRWSAVSLGPVALLVLGPFIAAVWLVYVLALVIYWTGRIIVEAVENIADAAEQRQLRRQDQDR